MRRILVELEHDIEICEMRHVKCANQLGAAVATITGEADVYTSYIKICKTPDGLRRARVIIIGTLVNTLEHEAAVIKLLCDKRAELDLFEIRFRIADEV